MPVVYAPPAICLSSQGGNHVIERPWGPAQPGRLGLGQVGNDEGRRPVELTTVGIPTSSPGTIPKNQLVGEGFENGRVPGPSTDPDLAIVLKKIRDNSIPLVGSPCLVDT
jgi:hypothetical protein